MNNKIWRCGLKSPCVKFCESENNKHQCGINRRNNMDNFIKIENKLKEFFKTEQTYKIYKELRIEKNTYYSMRSRKSIPYKKLLNYA